MFSTLGFYHQVEGFQRNQLRLKASETIMQNIRGKNQKKTRTIDCICLVTEKREEIGKKN